MMTNGEIRSDARSNVMQFFWPLMGLLSLALLIAVVVALLTSGALAILQGMFGGVGTVEKESVIYSLLNQGAQLLCVLVLAPYCVGACREIMEMFRDNAPRASRPLEWMGDALKRSRSYNLVTRLLLRALLIGLAAAAIKFLLASWLGQSGGVDAGALLRMGTDHLMQVHNGQAFVLITTLVDLGVDLIMLLYAPAIFLQAADLNRTAQECIQGGFEIVKSRYGSYLCMTIVIGLQTIAIGLVIGLAAVFLLAVFEFLSILAFIAVLAIEILFIFAIASYSAACTYLWARDKGAELGIALEIVD